MTHVHAATRTRDAEIAQSSGMQVADSVLVSRLARGLTSRSSRQLVLALAVALAIRLFVLVRAQGMMDGDEAVLGIQAEQILRGGHPLYFAGQAYMGTWDAYLVAPLVALFGPSAWALHVVTMGESLLLVPLLGSLSARLYGERARMPAMLLAALPPLYVTIGELRMLGGYVETLVLGCAVMLVATRIADRWEAGRPAAWLWILMSGLIGLGLWIDQLIAYYVLATAIWLAPHAMRRALLGWRQDLVRWAGTTLLTMIGCLVAVLIGGFPAALYAISNHYANVSMVQSSTHVLLQSDPLRAIAAEYLVVAALPRVFGIRFLWGVPSALHALKALVGLSAAMIAFLALSYALVLLVMRQRVVNGQGSALRATTMRARWDYAFAPLLLLAIGLIFWRSPATGAPPVNAVIDFAGRYVLPATTALTLALAALIADLPALLAPFGARMSGTSKRASAARSVPPTTMLAGLFVSAVMLTYALPYAMTDAVQIMQSPFRGGLTFPAEHAELLGYLEQHHVRVAWTNHWIGNVIMYMEDGRIVCVDYVDLMLEHGQNRFPEQIPIAEQADRPSFIVESDPALGEPRVAQALDALHVTYTSTQFGPLWVITPLSRTVAPAELAPALKADY